MGIFTVQDLGSTNGSKLNGERLAEGESVKLQDGDVLTVGKTDLRFEIR
jgi:pSer/pThr/pTyr-binding forkhead associated (FHA) protein